jgi:hypothetical protein
MLAPHHAVNTELGHGGLAALPFQDALVLFGGETVFTNNLGSDGGLLLGIGCHEIQCRNLYFLTPESRTKPLASLEKVIAAITYGYGGDGEETSTEGAAS